MAGMFQATCTNCQEDINGIRVQCCSCIDFDICLQCFSSGAEIGSHKNNHPYRLIEPCSGNVFGGRDNWTGQEELQLLEAIDSFGFGSWECVSRQVANRSPEEVKEKYMSRYFDGKIGEYTWKEVGDCRPIVADHTTRDCGPLAPEVTARLPPIDATPEQAAELGYVAHRDDFDREYDHDAEKLICDLQLSPKDSEIEKALQLAQVDHYMRRLRERTRRKRFNRDYQMIAKFFQEKSAKQEESLNTTAAADDGDHQRSEECNFEEKMKVFSQFLTSGEYQRLIEGIAQERELRYRLDVLLKYRSVGLTTQDEIVHYEQHAAFQKAQMARSRKTGSSGFRSAEELHSERNGSEELAGNLDLLDQRFMGHHDDENSCSCSQLDNSNLPPITTLPQANLLSRSELEFCVFFDLLPVQYRILKFIILQDNVNSNGKQQKKKLCNGEAQEAPSIKDIITEYLHHCGWLPACSMD